jgi:hypothetical protein
MTLRLLLGCNSRNLLVIALTIWLFLVVVEELGVLEAVAAQVVY